MIDDVEPLLTASRIIDRGHIGEVDEAQRRIVAQEAHDIDNFFGLHVDRELVEGDRMTGRGSGERTNNRLPQSVELAVIHTQNLQRSIVPVRRIFFCNSSTP